VDEAGTALRMSADALRQGAAGQTTRSTNEVEGRLNVTGANNIAAVMGRTIDSLQMQNAKTGVEGATGERVSAAMAGAMALHPVTKDDTAIPPIEGRLGRYQMFADQALRMGLPGEDAALLLREVKANPAGQLLPATRERLVHTQHEERGEAWNDSVNAVQTLEHTARLVPSSISAYGSRTLPQTAQTQIASGEPIVLTPTSKSGAVVFTPTQQPTVILASSNTTERQPLVFSPANGTRALDGLNTPNESTDSIHESTLNENDMAASIGENA